MIAAAVYARKSTEQHDVADDARSVARQVATARTFAEAHGWTLDDAHVFVDDGVSGAEFARRPGLVRLLAALKPRPAFGVLLVSDRDRIGREQIETSYVMKQIITAGVRIFECQGDDGREITLGSPTDKIIMAVQDFAAEVEREKSRSRTHAALSHRARAGRSTGGRTFGYETTRAADGTVTRTIAPAEAAVVRRIFQLTAEGHGRKAIAQRLNAEGAPSPRKGGQARGWAPSTVRDALGNALYRGVLVWNRTQRRDAWGQRHKGQHAAGDVVRVDVPESRIVDEPLWTLAQEKLAAGRALYAARNDTRNGGRPASGSVSRYLLSGLGECGQCGGSMFVHRRGGRDGRVPTFACTTRHLRGVTACKNRLEVPLPDTDGAVLAAVEHDLLNVAVLETALFKAMAILTPCAEGNGRAAGIRAELARLDTEVARLAGAIAAGGQLDALVSALQERERRRGQLRAELAQGEREAARETFDAGKVLARLRGHLADLQGLLRSDVASARPVLQALLAGRLVFTPGEQDGQRFYSFEGEGTVSAIIAGVVAGSKGSGSRTRTDTFWTIPIRGRVYRRAA